jgi:hypothetical protein
MELGNEIMEGISPAQKRSKGELLEKKEKEVECWYFRLEKLSHI